MNWPEFPELIYQHGEETEIAVREYGIACFAAGRRAGLEEATGKALEWTEAARKDGREYGVGLDIAAAIRALADA